MRKILESAQDTHSLYIIYLGINHLTFSGGYLIPPRQIFFYLKQKYDHIFFGHEKSVFFLQIYKYFT